MKTFYLDIQEEDHFDFDVFSLKCVDSIYSVINAINQELTIELEFTDLIEFGHENGGVFLFPLYSFTHPELNIEFNLLPNETSLQSPKHKIVQENTFDLFGGEIEQTVVLLPELSTTDYLLLVKGDTRYLYNHTILEVLKKINLFQQVKEIFIEDLTDKKSRSHLLF